MLDALKFMKYDMNISSHCNTKNYAKGVCVYNWCIHACNVFTMSQMALKVPLNKENLLPMQKWPLHNAIFEMLMVVSSSCHNVDINSHGKFIFENKKMNLM
jgi:hypothetical protein